MAGIHDIDNVAVQCSIYQQASTGFMHFGSAFLPYLDYSITHYGWNTSLKFVIKALSLSPTATTNRSGSIASYNSTLAYYPFPSVDAAVHLDRFVSVTVSTALQSLGTVALRCLVYRYLSLSFSSLREVMSFFQRSFRNLSNVSPSLCSSPLRLSTPRFELVADTLASLSLVNDGALHMDW